MNDNPRVSVIIPVYNVEPYLAECLDSVAAQTLADIEVICVDDASGDGSPALAERYAANDPRFTVIRHETNRGQGEARNTGLRLARGEFVAFVDSDDWILPETLEKEYRAIVEHGLNSVWMKLASYSEDTKTVDTSDDTGGRGFFDVVYSEKTGLPFSSCNKLYRARFLRDNGICFPSGVIYEDAEFFFKFCVLSPRTFVLDEHLYVYRQRSGSTMRNDEAGKARSADMCVIGENCCRFLRERGLFEKHNGDLLGFLAKTVGPYLFSRHYKESMILRTKEMLRNIGFPGEYANRRGDYGYLLFDTVAGCVLDASRYKYYTLLSLLNKLNPIPGLRRKWGVWIRVNCRSK